MNKQFQKILSVLFVILALMRFLPFLYPESRMFGFNHLIFISPIYAIIALVVLIIALVIPFLKNSPQSGERLANSFSSLYFENKNKYFYLFLTILLGSVLFYLFRAPTHFLGDGYTALNNLASQSGTIFKWSEAGTTTLLDSIQSLFGGKNIQTAKYAFQAVSIISGAISIFFFILISGEISKNSTRRFLAFICMFGSAVLLMFFGYVESYSPAWAAFSGFIYFTLRYLNRERGLIYIFIFLLIGILFHLQMAIYIPAVIYILFSGERGKALYKKNGRIIKVIIAVTIGFAIYVFVKKYRSDLYFENIFLPLFSGKPASPYYSLFSLPHLLDVLNQLLLLSPLLPLLLYLSFGGIKNSIKNRKVLALGLMAGAILIFLLIIDPKLGMPRDWDLFSFSALPLTLLLIILIPEIKLKGLSKYFYIIVLYLIVAVVPFLITNLGRNSSIIYMKYMINLDLPKAQSSILALRDYYYLVNDPLRADSLNVFYSDNFWNEKRIESAFSALDNNKLKLAETILSSIKPDKFFSKYHNLKSEIYFQQGKSSLALEESKKAIQLRQYDARLYSNQAVIYAAREEYESAYQALKKGYRLDSLNIDLIAGLAGYHLAFGSPDSVLIYSKKMIAIDSTVAYAYHMMAEVYGKQNSLQKATEYYNLYLKYKRSDSASDSSSSEFQQRIENIRENKQ